jgi:RNA polymerase sigma factor (sigma-70 family)
MNKSTGSPATPIGGWGINTPWTLLFKANTSNTADMERLLAIYWQPVYAFYRAQRLSAQDAEDLTQHLLMDFFLVRSSHKDAEKTRGKFRDYLLSAARHALLDSKKHDRAQKRGGGKKVLSLDFLKVEPQPDEGSAVKPEEEYDRQWALATWRAALELFRGRHGKQLVEAFDLFYSNKEELSQDEAARQLGISIAAFNSRVHTARRHVAECLKEIVRATVESDDELKDELAKLKDLLRQGGMA